MLAKTRSIKLEVIVVTENKQAKKSLEKNELLPLIDELIIAKEKSGFAGMNNLAIDKAIDKFSPDFVLLINDDAQVEKDFFKKLISDQSIQKADIIAPLILIRETNKLDSFGVEYFKSGYAKNALDTQVKTTLASASCLLVKEKLLQKMKLKYGFYFNDLLYFYLEDVEFCIRAVMLGAEIIKCKVLKVHHVCSASSGQRSYFTMYQTYRNIGWLIIMTWPLKVIFKNMWSILLVQAWIMFYSLKSFGPKLYVNLIIDTIKNLEQLINKRKKIIPAYKKNINFLNMFSPYTFRTYHNIKF